MDDKPQDDWDPRDSSILEDQRRAYDEMRKRCPVAHSEFMGWSLFRHEDVSAVLADPDSYSNQSQFLAIPNGMDSPEHGRYRKALDLFFDEKQIEKLEPRAREIAVKLLTPLQPGTAVEFVEDFAKPFALQTLCALLGWPEHLWECLEGWTHDSQQAAFTREPGAGKALAALFAEHVKTNLESHRAASSNKGSATDALLNLKVDGVQLDDEQIVSVLRNWTAGHGTVVAGLGILALHLANNPELQARLRSTPTLIPAAIEEILRTDGPLVANPRTTTREVELQGRTIPKGERLMLMWIAANRDPQVFDDPDAIKIERNTEASLVWGQGIHICQGAPLAQLEMRVALEELLLRTSSLALTDDAPQRAIYPGNGLARLPLRID